MLKKKNGIDLERVEQLPLLENITREASRFILGKQDQIELALCCLLARGHLLIEDIPGIGKTTLAKILAQLLGLDFQRIQCTSDMLPGDILGFSMFDKDSGSLSFRQGPIFTQVLLADEINRMPPKTQSALLEAMEEQQVSIEGARYALPEPFWVIATQNPLEQSGTYSLPESQLDRFLFRIKLGYPDRSSERILLYSGGMQQKKELEPVVTIQDVVAMQEEASQIHCSEKLVDYAQDLIDFSRNAAVFAVGLSPRAGLNLLRAAKAWAMIHKRDYVLPEDLQYLLPHLAGHRLLHRDTLEEIPRDQLVEHFSSVPVPP
jgi:MoxR-like ATPase